MPLLLPCEWHLCYILYYYLTFLFLYRSDDSVALYVDVNTRIQILDTMSRLPRADKEQCGAFIVCISIHLTKIAF